LDGSCPVHADSQAAKIKPTKWCTEWCAFLMGHSGILPLVGKFLETGLHSRFPEEYQQRQKKHISAAVSQRGHHTTSRKIKAGGESSAPPQRQNAVATFTLGQISVPGQANACTRASLPVPGRANFCTWAGTYSPNNRTHCDTQSHQF
jgi:hypothetical protein